MDNPYTLKTVFTVHEAAAAVHGITRTHRDDTPHLQSTFNELVHAIKAEELSARVPQKATGWLNGQAIGFRPEYSIATIARADLLTWCESRGIRPQLLFPDAPANPGPVEAGELSNYHTPALDALRAAVQHFWLNHDPQHPPKSTEIIKWLTGKHGLTPNMAKAIDRVIRPESQRRGGNVKI